MYFHSAGCDSAVLFHMLHGQCDFPWMQAVWHGNFPIVLSGDFCSIFAICNACILIAMFNVHPSSFPFYLVVFSFSLPPFSLSTIPNCLSPNFLSYCSLSLPHLPHCFLSCPLGCAFKNWVSLSEPHTSVLIF